MSWTVGTEVSKAYCKVVAAAYCTSVSASATLERFTAAAVHHGVDVNRDVALVLGQKIRQSSHYS